VSDVGHNNALRDVDVRITAAVSLFYHTVGVAFDLQPLGVADMFMVVHHDAIN
jgi:hypothetical protein